MNISFFLLPTLLVILLATSSYGQALDENNTNLTTPSALTTAITTLITSNATSYITITTVPITTQNATSSQTTATTDPTTTVTSAVTNITTPSTSNSTVTTTTLITTTKATGRKFDGFSFIGGIILALGLSGILYLVVSYLRRSNRLPYANLQ